MKLFKYLSSRSKFVITDSSAIDKKWNIRQHRYEEELRIIQKDDNELHPVFGKSDLIAGLRECLGPETFFMQSQFLGGEQKPISKY